MEQQMYLDSVKEAIVTLDFEGIGDACQKAIDAGIDPQTIIVDAMACAMEVVGQKFEAQEYFLSELIVSAEVMKEGMEVVLPYVKGSDNSVPKTIVIATVEGDFHDIGKNIVVSLLKAQGFNVVDLGVDVTEDTIIKAVKEHKPVIVAMSALLSNVLPKMGEVVERLKAEGMRNDVKVVIGGCATTPEFAEKIGADLGGLNAVDTTNRCVEWSKAV